MTVTKVGAAALCHIVTRSVMPEIRVTLLSTQPIREKSKPSSLSP